MLEGIGAYLINYYLGEFLENINYDQLTFQLLSGEISLENVPIRRGSTLHRFGLPLDIIEGKVLKIKIIRPSATRFLYDPFIIEVEGLELVLGPTNSTINQDTVDNEQELCQRRIEQLISRLQMVGQQQGYWSSYSSSIITQIIQNIQVKIENVCVSYCDFDILGSRSIGTNIRRVSISNLTNDSAKSAKKLGLQDLSVYSYYDSSREYILCPVNTDVIITKDKNPMPLTGEDPRFKVGVAIGDVVVQLSDKQHHILYSIVEKLDWFQRRQRFKVGRPLVTLGTSDNKSIIAREWWKWAINVHYLPIKKYHERNTKEFVIQRCGEINIYKRLIIRLLQKEVLSDEDKTKKKHIEDKWDYDEIKNVIYAAIDKEYRPLQENDTTNKEGWGSWVMRGGGLFRALPPDQIESISEELVTEPAEKPILQLKNNTINGLQRPKENTYELTVSNDSFLTRDEHFAQVSFNLQSGVIRLNVEDERKTTESGLGFITRSLVRIQFNELTSLLSFKFRSESITSIVELAQFTVFDDHTEKTIYPKLISTSRTNTVSISKVTPVFYFSHERNGLVHSIYCETAPLTIIHNAELMRMAKGFFSRKNNIVSEDGLEIWRQRERYRGLKLGAKRNLQSAWDQVISGKTATAGSNIHITLDLAAPKIIIPQDIKNKNSPQILIDFGRLKFSNVSDEKSDEKFFTPDTSPPSEQVHEELLSTKLNSDELHERLVISKLYYKYSINLLDLQILVGNHVDAWRDASTGNVHIVERFNVSLGLERRVLDRVTDTKYPFAMLSGNLPSLALHLNETKCATLWGCLNQLNYVESEVPTNTEDQDEINLELSNSNVEKLMYMIFQIEKVTVQLFSEIHHNQAIAALEISQVKSEIKVSSVNQSCIFSISSIVLVDCYHKLGPDFDFILASNGGVYLDIPSGTLIDSGATSPTHEKQASSSPETPNFVSKLTGNLLNLLETNNADQSKLNRSRNPNNDLAALEWTHWNNPIHSDIVDDVSIHFSSLDIIASPPSIAVLLRLLYRLKPKSYESNENKYIDGDDGGPKPVENHLTVVTIEVDTVNVMIATANVGIGRKVASAGIEKFKSTAILHKTGDVTLDGKIGSIYLLDLDNDEVSCNRIFALGQSLQPDEHFETIFSRQQPGDDAFNFEFKRQQTANNTHDLVLNLHTASLCYLHSPRFLASFISCSEQFKLEFSEQLTADAQLMYQSVMSGLYQRVADFAKGPTQLSIFKMHLNFKSPYVALPKHANSNEYLFGQLGCITIHNSGLENFYIGIEQAAVNSLYKQGTNKMEDRGEILNGTDLIVRLSIEESVILVDIGFDSEPIVTVTKQTYEQILKSLDNIALPNNEKPENTNIEDLSTKPEDEKFKAIHTMLTLHGLTIDLRDEMNKPTVKLIFSDFELEWEKLVPDEFTCNLVLGALEAIDSLEKPESHMLRSKKPQNKLRKSNSWPKISKLNYLKNKRLCSYTNDRSNVVTKRASMTNRPILRPSISIKTNATSDESVVKIFMKQKNPKDRSGEREIKLKFSQLEAGVNLQTWVMLLDFFTPSSSSLSDVIIERSVSSETGSMFSDCMTPQTRLNRRQAIENQGAPVDVKIEFVVDRFSILFKKPEYTFAKASIDEFEMRMIMWEKTHRYSGHLQKLTFYDLSPCGHKYRERFVTMDEKALGFELFRYTKADRECLRAWDIRFKLNMNQIKYIHTHRFQSELIAYFLHFHQLQELVNHYRAALVGETITELNRGSRVKLEITAKNPTLILPESAHSNRLIVADLGHLTVQNTFPRDGDVGTLNHELYQKQNFKNDIPVHKCLMDCIQVKLKDMNIWTASRVSKSSKSNTLEYGTFCIEKDERSLLQQKVVLDLQVERNLEQGESGTIPDMAIKGTLSRAHFSLDMQQFWTVRGFLDHNLGEMQPIYSLPTGEVGSSNNYMDTVISGVVVTNLMFELGLKNVTVELGFTHTDKLVKMEFIESKLKFEAFSNNHKHTSLVCQSYNAADLRKKVNIHNSFRNVIQTSNNKSKQKAKDKVQVELFFKATPTAITFKLLMETSRIIILPEWMQMTLNYLIEHPEPEYSDRIRQKVLDYIIAANQEPDNPGSTEVEIGKQLPLHITSNIHATQFILIDDLTNCNSHGIILCSTAVVQKDDHSACLSLQSLEVFSCEIMNEKETSLSILDPTSLEFSYNQVSDQPFKFDINLNSIQMRLSYRDYILLLSIAKNIKFDISACENNGKKLKEQKSQRVFWRAEPMCTMNQDDIIPHLPKLVELPEGFATLSADTISLTLIDDSGDCDIPLVEFEAKKVIMEANEKVSTISLTLKCFLYNQKLSLWEPLVEPFNFQVVGGREKTGYNIAVRSMNRLNINVTQNLLHFHKEISSRVEQLFSPEATKSFIRAKFKPYTIVNRTGINIMFGTSHDETAWKILPPNKYSDFNFVRQHEKVRNYQHKMDRIWFKIEEWSQIEPVTVNKVGTFFRHGVHPNKDPIRIVIEVKLKSSARKLVMIRSAFQIVSKVSIPIDIFCQIPSSTSDGTAIDGAVIGTIQPNEVFFVEVNQTNSELRLRPSEKTTNYSTEPLKWCNKRNIQCSILRCEGKSQAHGVSYEISKVFFSRIEKLKFPTGQKLKNEILELERRASNGKARISTFANLNFDKVLPGHNCYIYPAITIKNLLPIDLTYILSGERGTILPHKLKELYFYPDSINLKLILEGFETSGEIILPRDRQCTVEGRILDDKKRLLLLTVKLQVEPSIVISISSKYWLVNQTSLPLVFRQKDCNLAAGQFDDHEQARCRTPLLFSYSDPEAQPYCQVRLGRKFSSQKSLWSNEFSLEDECHRELESDQRLYYVGISVSNGSGDYKDTKIVTLSPRIILQNSTQFNLKFSQQHLIFGLWERDPEHCVEAPPSSNCNFHWCDPSSPTLLCVRISSPFSSKWSGGFNITKTNTCYLNIRVGSSDTVFLEVEVIYQFAIFFVLFRELNDVPPLIRIDNLSAVPITILQDGAKDASIRVEIPPESSMPYSMDEPALPEILICQVRNSRPIHAVLTDLESTGTLHYENLLYLVSNNKVLDVDGSYLLFLTTKNSNRRSQLWRIDSRGTLVNANFSEFVLDPTSLELTTQKNKIHTWQFKEDVLCFGNKRLNSNTITGNLCFTGDNLAPVKRERLLKGSGQLELRVVRDGPRRVLQVLDVVQSRAGTSVDSGCTFVESADRKHFLASTKPNKYTTGISVSIIMNDGIGVSAIASVTDIGLEELFYFHATGVMVTYELKRNTEKIISLSVDYIQADNQIDGAFPRVMLQKVLTSKRSEEPCFNMNVITLPNNKEHNLFRLFKVETSPISLNLDHGLILRLMMLLKDKNAENFPSDPQSIFLNRLQQNSERNNRSYFEEISIKLGEVHASLYKQSELPFEVKRFKDSELSFPLIQFEDARIEIKHFSTKYQFKALRSHQNDYQLFLVHSLRSQAYKIFGSCDFLGNPLGLAHDVKEGFNGVMQYGDLSSVFQGTTRGVANSASKFIGTVADVVSSFAIDPSYEEDRRRRRTRESSEFGNVVDGLAYGVVGGLTSVFSQTFNGIKNDGPSGLITGLGKGVMGAVVKPVTGVLDFATGTASIIRDKTEYRLKSKPDRSSRLTRGINGGLPTYNENHAQAQNILREINQNSKDPLFCVEKVSSELLLFITSQSVLLYGENFVQQLNVSYSNMRQVVAFKNKLIIDLDTNSRFNRQQIDCVDENQAKILQLMVSSVRDLYRDSQHTLRN